MPTFYQKAGDAKSDAWPCQKWDFSLVDPKGKSVWLWVKNRYPKWITDGNQGLKPAVPWFNFDPCPCNVPKRVWMRGGGASERAGRHASVQGACNARLRIVAFVHSLSCKQVRAAMLRSRESRTFSCCG